MQPLSASVETPSADTLAPPQRPESEIPEWVTGTKECQRQLIPGVRIYSDQGKVFLSLSEPTATTAAEVSNSEPGNKVVFEVRPDALLGSEEEELRHLQLLQADFEKSGLFRSKLFHALSADESGRMRIAELHIDDRNVNISGHLAAGATVSGKLTDGMLSLEGQSVQLNDLSVSGASTIFLNCPNATISGVNFDEHTVLLGTLNGLMLGAQPSRIKSYAVELGLRECGTGVDPKDLARTFVGARLSEQQFNLALLATEVKHLSHEEKQAAENSLNELFLKRHFPRVSSQTAIGEISPPLLLSAEETPIKVSLQQLNGSAPSIEFEFRLRAAIPNDLGGETSHLLLSLPLPTPGQPAPAPVSFMRVSAEVPATEAADEAQRTIARGDVPFALLDGTSGLYQLYLWKLLFAARGEFSRFRNLHMLGTLSALDAVEVQPTTSN